MVLLCYFVLTHTAAHSGTWAGQASKQPSSMILISCYRFFQHFVAFCVVYDTHTHHYSHQICLPVCTMWTRLMHIQWAFNSDAHRKRITMSSMWTNLKALLKHDLFILALIVKDPKSSKEQPSHSDCLPKFKLWTDSHIYATGHLGSNTSENMKTRLSKATCSCAYVRMLFSSSNWRYGSIA